MLSVFLSQENSLIVITTLSAHANCSVQIEVRAGFDEDFELVGIL